MAWSKEVLQKGDKGDLVLSVQKQLTALGYKVGPVDGIYGAQTIQAVQEFQKANGLAVDGMCGPLTGKKLEEVVLLRAQKSAGAPVAPVPTKMPPALDPKAAAAAKAGAMASKAPPMQPDPKAVAAKAAEAAKAAKVAADAKAAAQSKAAEAAKTAAAIRAAETIMGVKPKK